MILGRVLAYRFGAGVFPYRAYVDYGTTAYGNSSPSGIISQVNMLEP